MAPESLNPPQSVFQPASAGADLIDMLTIMLIIGATLLWLLVMGLLARNASGAPTPVNARRWLVGGGLLLPVVVLAALLWQGLRIGAALAHPPELKGLEVQVIARRWWWEFRYPHPEDASQVVVANELHLPADCAVVLRLVSHDVIHSFWVPALAGKVDTVPGVENRLHIHAARPGRYRGQCAEYCGTQHANMALEVVVETPTGFREWLLHQAQPAMEPADAQARRGQQVFMKSGCGTCHAIRGTTATGVLGPDLTHLASRRMLASATLPNNAATLADWIRDAQHLKPGNLMPSMPLPADSGEMRALVAYLGSLR